MTSYNKPDYCCNLMKLTSLMQLVDNILTTSRFSCVLVLRHSGENNVCGFTLSLYSHTRQAEKICLTTVGIEPTTFEMLAQCSANWATRSGRFEVYMWYFAETGSSSFDSENITYSNRPNRVAHLVEHWVSIHKRVGSIPTVVRNTFQLALCGYKLKVKPQTSFRIKETSALLSISVRFWKINSNVRL